MHSKLKLESSATCPCGQEDQTTEHVLQRCPPSQSYERRCVACQHFPDDQTLRLQTGAGEDVILLPSGLDRVDCERQEEDRKTPKSVCRQGLYASVCSRKRFCVGLPGSWGRCTVERCTSCLHLWRSWARAWVVTKLFPVSISDGHGQGLGSWQSSYLFHLRPSWARAWVVAKLFPVSTSDGHGQGLGSWQSSSLSPPLMVMGKGLGRGKALPCPHSNVVHPFLSLPAPSSSTLNSALEDGLRQATGSCHMIIPLQNYVTVR